MMPAFREVFVQRFEAAAQKAKSRRPDAGTPEQPVIEHEQKCDALGALGRSRERGVVRETQIAPEPVDDVHARSVRASPDCCQQKGAAAGLQEIFVFG
jgi:hypothetical protein